MYMCVYIYIYLFMFVIYMHMHVFCPHLGNMPYAKEIVREILTLWQTGLGYVWVAPAGIACWI